MGSLRGIFLNKVLFRGCLLSNAVKIDFGGLNKIRALIWSLGVNQWQTRDILKKDNASG